MILSHGFGFRVIREGPRSDDLEMGVLEVGDLVTEGATVVWDRQGAWERQCLMRLTDQEIRIIRFLADGVAVSEIARILNYSLRTIKSRLQSIRSKLAACTNANVVYLAMKAGIIE